MKHSKAGSVMNIRETKNLGYICETKNLGYIFSNIALKDWEACEP